MSTAREAMSDLFRRYENGLDTAGVSESQWFADWANDLAAGRCDMETALLAVFDRFGERNGNEDVALEFLRAALEAHRTAQRQAADDDEAFRVNEDRGARE